MDTVPSAAIAERFGTLFDTLDSDNDATLTWDDYQRLVDRYAKGYSLDADDTRARAIHAAYHGLWDELVRRSESADGSLDREAFVGAMRAVSEDTSRSNPTEALADAVFDLLDDDDNGSISEAEYVEYAEILGATVDTAWERFKALDTDGDGSISREEFIQSGREFLFGEDTESAGGFVFGMV
ncbi:EF-hand domain-containing protein [Nocardiopsis sp. EMB25]|uniref:EF-hand domain-containing protein n=1 Tax=Nocardiopsis TaxID=2013 RepID=UPI0003472B07|nr:MULTISPECIES: EF-hand domain-containing protein [Nocardiopsis]MCY9785636.1 EF-hand domain-containing protein [Nocardiopsis sp. EMB25]